MEMEIQQWIRSCSFIPYSIGREWYNSNNGFCWPTRVSNNLQYESMSQGLEVGGELADVRYWVCVVLDKDKVIGLGLLLFLMGLGYLIVKH
ncbi:unnamed protein product [Prunus armeniaca]